MYDVSRIPVRDALLTLLNDGLVERNRQNQMVVRAFTEEDLRDTLLVEATLSGMTAGRAALRAGADDLEELKALLDEADGIIAGEGQQRTSELSRISWAFHRKVNLTARSKRLSAALRSVSVNFAQDLMSELPEWWMTSSHAEHRLILEAISQRDAERAKVLTVTHFDHLAEEMVRTLRAHATIPA